MLIMLKNYAAVLAEGFWEFVSFACSKMHINWNQIGKISVLEDIA